jgi:hypothetical protein
VNENISTMKKIYATQGDTTPDETH